MNTVLLITGSWCVARAVEAVGRARSATGARWLLAGIACGGGFLVVKGFEYGAKFGAGINLSTNTFYMFYLSLTFFHFMHVILGLVIARHPVVEDPGRRVRPRAPWAQRARKRRRLLAYGGPGVDRAVPAGVRDALRSPPR